MEKNVRKDSRFAHITSDPRFKRIPKTELKVKIDKRFQSMFSDGRFKLKYTVDKRGRPGNHTSSEDLKRYYDLSSDDSGSDSSDKDEDSEDGAEASDDEESLRKTAKSASKSDDKSDSETDAESGVKEQNDIETEGLSEAIKEKLHDSKVDYARGEAVLLSDSSSDEESSEGELEADVRELDHEWGELDRDAERTDEITSRIAVCNMDWDRIRSSDLMVLFSSFLPPGGLIHTVTIYPSEYGMERMKQEEASGPVELLNDANHAVDDDECRPEDENEEGSKYHMEKLRQYQLTRLKYYYAVVVFDSPASANKVYAECDGMEYESSSTRLDLRFVPDDTTFDQTAREVCDRLPEPSKYAPCHFTTTALQQARVELTWDETDPRRAEVAGKISAGTADDDDIHAYLASSSGEEEQETEQGRPDKDDDGDDSDESPAAVDPISKYRALLLDIEQAEEEKKSRGVEMEVTWGVAQRDKSEKLVKKKMKEGEEAELTPFQRLLEKRKEKKRAKREEREKKKTGQTAPTEDNPYSDDDIPSDVDMNDPYFAEEFKDETQPSKTKKRKDKKKAHVEEEEDEETKRKKAELELLLMEEDDGRQHFSLKKIQEKEAATSGSKKKKRKMKRKTEKEAKTNEDDFEVDVKDERFSALFSSHHYNIDPADPHYRKTKGMEALRAEKLSRRPGEDVDLQHEVVMSFPTKAERQTCWDSRDRYWDCLDANPTQQEVCAKLRQAYEATCPGQWVKHFDRKKNYLKFKERIEKDGYEPLPK